MKKIEELIEDVVAGDSAGNAVDIAAGKNSGAVVGNPSGKVNKQQEPEQENKE